jgi:serine/threonine protein kinase
VSLDQKTKCKSITASSIRSVCYAPDSCKAGLKPRHSNSPGKSSVSYDYPFFIHFESRSLLLVCDSEQMRSIWVKALTWLFEFTTTISGPFNVQHLTHVDRDFTWTMKNPDEHAGGGQSPSMANIENEFKFNRCLGKGSFGRVYKATHLAANSVVAIKVCKVNPFNSDLDTVKKEVNMLKTVRHPNIVDFFGCWGPDKRDRLWILTEYCALGSITDVLHKTKIKLSELQIAVMCVSVLKALVYLHTVKQVWHRDIKASNILITEDGLVKLADFGISKKIEGLQAADLDGHTPLATPALTNLNTPVATRPGTPTSLMGSDSRRDSLFEYYPETVSGPFPERGRSMSMVVPNSNESQLVFVPVDEVRFEEGPTEKWRPWARRKWELSGGSSGGTLGGEEIRRFSLTGDNSSPSNAHMDSVPNSESSTPCSNMTVDNSGIFNNSGASSRAFHHGPTGSVDLSQRTKERLEVLEFLAERKRMVTRSQSLTASHGSYSPLVRPVPPKKPLPLAIRLRMSPSHGGTIPSPVPLAVPVQLQLVPPPPDAVPSRRTSLSRNSNSISRNSISRRSSITTPETSVLRFETESSVSPGSYTFIPDTQWRAQRMRQIEQLRVGGARDSVTSGGQSSGCSPAAATADTTMETVGSWQAPLSVDPQLGHSRAPSQTLDIDKSVQALQQHRLEKARARYAAAAALSATSPASLMQNIPILHGDSTDDSVSPLPTPTPALAQSSVS